MGGRAHRCAHARERARAHTRPLWRARRTSRPHSRFLQSIRACVMWRWALQYRRRGLTRSEVPSPNEPCAEQPGAAHRLLRLRGQGKRTESPSHGPLSVGPLAQHDKDRTQIRNASTHLRRSTSPSRRCVAHRISGADVRACGDTSRPLSCGAGAPKDAARVQPPAVHRRVMRLTCPANLCCAQYCRTPGAMRCGDPALLLAASAGKPYARRRVQLS